MTADGLHLINTVMSSENTAEEEAGRAGEPEYSGKGRGIAPSGQTQSTAAADACEERKSGRTTGRPVE